MRKAFTVEQIVKAVKMTKDAGIEVHGFFILGSPPDNKEMIEQTIKFAKDLELNYASFNIYVPYPGTESFERLKKEVDVSFEFITEVFSSQAGDRMGVGVSRDEKSAMVILQSYLEKTALGGKQ